MNGHQARELRREAERLTRGAPQAVTRRVYQKLKREWPARRARG